MPKKSCRILIFVLLVALIAALSACTLSSDSDNPFINVENPGAIGNFDKKETIDRTTDAIQNLKDHLQSDTVSDTGYFIDFDMDFDSDDGSHFTLKFKANLYTFPYYKLDDNGDVIIGADGKPEVDEEKLAKHNEVIKQSDLIIEWFDGHTNRLLIGLYFDGKNSSANDPGNNLYVNLRGETRRMFRDFGDTNTFRQLVRLITSIDVEKMLGGNEGIDGSVQTLNKYLNLAVSDNYKVTKNDDIVSIFYEQINLDVISKDITGIVHQIFTPFGTKLDPLTEYYLGFKFSTPGGADVRTVTTDLRFLLENSGGKELVNGAEINADGTALVEGKIVPFHTEAQFNYNARVDSGVKVANFIDRTEYKEFLNGQYEYQGELYVPMMEKQGMESRMDAVVRTKLTSDVDKNDENRIQMSFTDKANGSRLLLGAYYCNERTYLNTTGLQNLYGGIKINEIGFPRAYIDGPNIAELLSELNQTIDDIITDYVDGVIQGTGSSVLFDEIMSKMSSGDGSISIRIDLELIKVILRETQDGHPEYSTQDIIDLLSDQIGYDLEEIAFMLGIPDAKRMLEKTWFDLTYYVATSAIRIELSSNAMNETETMLIFRLDLNPVKIGETVTFPEGFDGWFDEYKELQEVKTISASVSGTVSFANSAAVDVSELLGAMIGDKSGLNTRYFLPASSSLGFSLVFDQYVKFDQYGDDVYPGDVGGQLNEMRGRIGLKLQVFEKLAAGGQKPLLNVYAKDVAFNTNCEEDKLGYVWVDIPATGFTKVKIREDVFLASLNDYMGGNSAAEDAMALSIPQIVGALLEDSNSLAFLPDVIQLSTSNRTIQKLFGVKAVLLSADIDVGLTPRVKGIAQLEGEFADYTVGELADMTGDDKFSHGVYEKNLYDTIDVTFNRGGSAWVEKLRVPYYRVPAPGAPSDYDSQEDYDAAVLKYAEYLASQHSLEVVDGKTLYYPSTDGDFMGQFRSYIVEIRKTGGSSLTAVTSRITALSDADLVWEPLEAEPDHILGMIRNGSVSVPAAFSIDWDSVTIDGCSKALYTVTIGPGSIGETVFSVYITVRNRRIVQENGNPSELKTVYPEAVGAKTAPIAAGLDIDPYDYILWRGDYVRTNGAAPANPIGQYLQSRSELRSVIFRFGDGRTERVELVWAFDDPESGGLNREEYISAEGGNALAAHAYFHNQLVALRIKVLPKVFDHVMFEGETEQNVYTVDVLNTASKTVPTRPTVYFRDGTSRRFAFDLLWAFPVADNVTLRGAAVVDGVESPFTGHVGNDDFAWLSIRRIYGDAAGWFSDVPITVTVKAPAKNIEKVYQVINPIGENSGIYYARNVQADGGTVRGYWVVDPLNPGSQYLPASLTAYFVGENNVKTERHYGSDVVRFESAAGYLSPINDGKYLFTEPSVDNRNTVRVYAVKGWISEEFSFDFFITVLPDYDKNNDSLYFFNQNDMEYDAAAISKDLTDKDLYRYTLDPFVPLELPETFEIRSAIASRTFMLTPVNDAGETTGSSYAHFARYEAKPDARANERLDYQYVVDGIMGVKLVAYLRLVPKYALTDVEKLVLVNGVEIFANAIDKGFRFETFRLNAEGFVLDNEGRPIVLYGADVKLADYIRYLLSAVKVIINSGEIVTIDPAIINFEKFDVQDTLSENGAAYVVALSEIPNYMNVNVTIHAEGLETIASGNTPALSITPFTADGKEVYPGGYPLYQQEFPIAYNNDNPPLLFRSNAWTVSQVINLKGGLLQVGSSISVLSADVLRADREDSSAEIQILLYAFLPDSSKVTLTVRIASLDFQAFESSKDELFPIIADSAKKYSVVVVRNMYAFRQYLVDAGTFVSHLPTTIKIGGTELNGVRWIADAGLEENLKNLKYRNPETVDGITEFKISAASVDLGSAGNPYSVTIDLYVRFLPAILDKATPEGAFGNASGVYFEGLVGNAESKAMTFRVKPYATPEGNIAFAFPARYRAKFQIDDTEYDFPFRVLYGGVEFGESLRFDYDGTTYRNFRDGDTKNAMKFTFDAGFGQLVTVNLLFIDQTVGELSSGTSDIWFGKSENGVYSLDTLDKSENRVSSNFVIDPYGTKYKMPGDASVFIPTYVRINDVKSMQNEYSASDVYVLWSGYGVPYGGQNDQELQGTIKRTGMTDQIVRIKFSVLNRETVIANVLFEAKTFPGANGVREPDGAVGGDDVRIYTKQPGMPTAHIKNPFVFRVENDLPTSVKEVRYTNGEIGYNIPIYWEATDQDVVYNGNNMTAKQVRYRLYDQNGQQFNFYFEIDRWDYVSLERQVGGSAEEEGVWQEMNPIYFLISSISGKSDVETFRLQFRVTDAAGVDGIYNGSQIFYSETSNAATLSKMEPVLYFDREAIRMAVANGSEVLGTFSLGGEGKLMYTVEKSMETVYYSSAKPAVLETYFRYSALTTVYDVPFVLIDPLSPVWPTKLYAYVNWTNELVELTIPDEGDPFGIDLLKYINRGGGVVVGRSVYVDYVVPETNEKIRFKHKIDILFMDRTPISRIPAATVDGREVPPTSVTLVTKDSYNRNTYDGRSNPYSDSYEKATQHLNTAVRVFGSSVELRDVVWEETHSSDPKTYRSVSFTVDGREIGSADNPCPILETAINGTAAVKPFGSNKV